MSTEEMKDFIEEQREIFSEKSRMGKFLNSVSTLLEDREETSSEYSAGDIVVLDDEPLRAIILDTKDEDGNYYVFTENGCVEIWYTDGFHYICSKDHLIENLLDSVRDL